MSERNDRILSGSGLAEVWAKIKRLIETKADIDHNHDDRYYTEDEFDKIIGNLKNVPGYNEGNDDSDIDPDAPTIPLEFVPPKEGAPANGKYFGLGAINTNGKYWVEFIVTPAADQYNLNDIDLNVGVASTQNGSYIGIFALNRGIRVEYNVTMKIYNVDGTLYRTYTRKNCISDPSYNGWYAQWDGNSIPRFGISNGGYVNFFLSGRLKDVDQVTAMTVNGIRTYTLDNTKTPLLTMNGQTPVSENKSTVADLMVRLNEGLDNKVNIEYVENNFVTIDTSQEISGSKTFSSPIVTNDVKTKGTVTLDIEDEDFDSGIILNKSLDNNAGTVISMIGYVKGEETNWYKPIVRNIGEPKQDYDAVNKKYVDNKVSVEFLIGYLNEDNTVLVSSNAYDKAYECASGNKECYLKLSWVDAIYILQLKSWENYNEHSSGGDVFVFEDNTNANVNRTVRVTKDGAFYIPMILEDINNKSQSINTDKNSVVKYPSTKATYDFVEMEIERRYPVVIYDGTEGLKVPGSLVDGTYTAGTGLVTTSQGEGAVGKGTITKWNITGADFSQFKYLRVVYKRNSTGSGTTAEFNVPLDCLPIDGTGQKYFVAGSQAVTYGDRNRMNCIMCGVDEAKTSFAVLQTFSLYGTAVTEVNNIRVVRIEGIYKDANPYPIANHAEEVEF